MYQVSIEQHFDAAHYLRDYQGKCESLHGHRYVGSGQGPGYSIEQYRPLF